MKAAGAPGLHQQEGFGVILALQDLHAQSLVGVELGDELRGVGALRHHHRLALEVIGGLEPGRFQRDPFELRGVEDQRERDLALPREWYWRSSRIRYRPCRS